MEIWTTGVYRKWYGRLRDPKARARVDKRIQVLAEGHPGDVKPVGGGVSELKIDYGPGYRIYFARRGQEIIILLAGGEKKTQDRDIVKAKTLAREILES